MGTLRELLESGLEPSPDRPLFPGAVALVLRDGDVIGYEAVGESVRYGGGPDGPFLLSATDRRPMAADTIFDVASLSKLFTAVVALKTIEEGLVDLDAPVTAFIPEWSSNGDPRGTITLRHLLTHTSGLPAVKRLWEIQPEGRVPAVFDARISQPPGEHFEYSCIGYIVAGFLLERLTGKKLDQLVDDIVLRPLGLADTTYRPGADLVPHIAATEHQPYAGRGIVRGEVHDETNWSLGGVAGNAGLFSTAQDIARFGEMLRTGGELDGQHVLHTTSVEAMGTDQLPAALDPGWRQGFGPRINDRIFMGALADHYSIGHTGFTGASLVVTPSLGLTTVLLTNRVHPSRDWSEISAFRREVAAWALSNA